MLRKKTGFFLTLSLALAFPAAADQSSLLKEHLAAEVWYAGKNLTHAQKEELKGSLPIKGAIARAEISLSQTLENPFPNLFLEFQKSGNRSRFQDVYNNYSRLLAMNAEAYYATGEKKYLRKLESLIEKVCAFPTWVLPAHDKKLINFSGKNIEIDLASSIMGWRLATIYSLFKNDLSPSVAAKMKAELNRRIIEPFYRIATGKRAPFWWMTRKMNWNAVCLAGITGTVLAMEQDRSKRILMIDTALKYSKYFLESFESDGYCSEGASYWNYGFGHYLYMAAMLYLATDGKLNLLEQPETTAPAHYPDKIVIAGGWIPAFADCNYTTKIAPQFLDLHDLLLKKDEKRAPLGWLPELFLSAELSKGSTLRKQDAEKPEAFSDFPAGGVAVMRPGPDEAYRNCRLAVAVKGGSNDELHNHNDVGSYTIIVDGAAPVAGDPGAEVYNAGTFGEKRYESQIMNSYGHPVPRPADSLQVAGKNTKAILLEEKKTPDSVFRKLDISSAYRIASMEKLERSFDYSRKGAGSFTVTDHVKFSSPQFFESAAIAFGTVRKRSDSCLELAFAGKHLTVRIETGGVPFSVETSVVKGEYQGGLKPTRIAIRLKERVKEATIKLIFKPAEAK